MAEPMNECEASRTASQLLADRQHEQEIAAAAPEIDLKAAAEDRYFTINQAAVWLGVSRRSVTNWIAGGKLKAWRTPGGGVRVRQGDLLTSARVEEPHLLASAEG